MSKSKQFNGHKNWNHWNVSLWMNNDEGLYRLVKECSNGISKDKAAKALFAQLRMNNITHTPDGAPYSVSSIRAAMVGM